MRKAARATRERIIQPPTVPPMIGARDCFFCPASALVGEDEVGVVAGEGVAVTVTTIADGVAP